MEQITIIIIIIAVCIIFSTFLLIYLVIPTHKKNIKYRTLLNYDRMAVMGYSLGAQMISRIYESFPKMVLLDGKTPFPPIRGGVMIAGGSMRCFVDDEQTCPKNTSEPTYDNNKDLFINHPPTLLTQTDDDPISPPDTSNIYFNTLHNNQAPVAIVNTGGERHGLCPCAVDPIINFLEHILLSEHFSIETGRKDFNKIGGQKDFKEMGQKDFKEIRWNAGKNPDADYFRKLFTRLKNGNLYPRPSPGARNPRENLKNLLLDDETYKSKSDDVKLVTYVNTKAPGCETLCTIETSQQFPLTQEQLKKPAVIPSYSRDFCDNDYELCANSIQYWVKILNADWIIHQKYHTNNRKTAIAIPRYKKRPKNGWPFLLYLQFMTKDGKTDGWDIGSKKGGLSVEINNSNWTRKELYIIFENLLHKGIAIIFTSEFSSNTYFYA